MANAMAPDEGTPGALKLEAQAKPEQLLTVSDLGLKHGNTHKPAQINPKTGKLSAGTTAGTVSKEDGVFNAAHMQADAAHGWNRHFVFKNQEVRLSDEDYLAAVAATKTGADKTHGPANKRTETVFTDDEMKSRMEAHEKVRKSTPAAPRKTLPTTYWQDRSVAKARKLMETSGYKKGAR
jgi:hypothetical protein